MHAEAGGGEETTGIDDMPALTVADPDQPDHPHFVYDEFGLFEENLDEFDLDPAPEIVVRRDGVEVPDAGTVSVLRWGTGSPRTVFLHGAAQNAHTWDTVLLALGLSAGRVPDALCIDLPGHGHSTHRSDGRYDPRSNAVAVAEVIRRHVDEPVRVVGMSLGGLTANALAAAYPELVADLVVVDITPGVNHDKAREIHDFIAGPQTFESFRSLLDRTVAFNPTRSVSSLRRGILHNAHRLPDGQWAWRYDRREVSVDDLPEVHELWEDVSATNCPYLLVRGGTSPVVDDADVAELLRRRHDAEVVVVEGAGHSVQGDRPRELAEIIEAR